MTGVCFADLGNDVTCLDIDERKIAALQAGVVADLRAGPGGAGRAQYARRPAPLHHQLRRGACRGADFCFIAVNTPEGPDGQANMGAVRGAARMIGEAMRGHTIIINKSTMPIGTGDLVASRSWRRTRSTA